LRPNQLAVGRELDEVMGLPVANALALIGGLTVNRLPRIVRNVNGPVGHPGQTLGEAWPIAEIPLGLPGNEKLGSRNRHALLTLAGSGATATPGSECGKDQSYRDEAHARKYRHRYSRGWRRG
jgi:hypothetical protein